MNSLSPTWQYKCDSEPSNSDTEIVAFTTDSGKVSRKAASVFTSSGRIPKINSDVYKRQVQEKAQAAGKINWTLDNKPLSEWKTWDMETGTLSKDPFLTITETANGNDLDLHIDVQDLFGEDLSLRSPNNIRRALFIFNI